MNLNKTTCIVESPEDERFLSETSIADLMKEAKRSQVEKISLVGRRGSRVVYVLNNQRLIRILDSLIKEMLP